MPCTVAFNGLLQKGDCQKVFVFVYFNGTGGTINMQSYAMTHESLSSKDCIFYTVTWWQLFSYTDITLFRLTAFVCVYQLVPRSIVKAVISVVKIFFYLCCRYDVVVKLTVVNEYLLAKFSLTKTVWCIGYCVTLQSSMINNYAQTFLRTQSYCVCPFYKHTQLFFKKC